MPLRFELTVQTPSMYRYHQPSPIFPCTVMISWKSVPRTKQRAIMTGERISNSSSCTKKRGIKSKLEEAPQGFCSMLARAPALCFSRNFLCFRFSGLLKAIKRAMSNVRTILCCSKYYQNDFRCEAKVPRREALASDNLALIFFSLLR